MDAHLDVHCRIALACKKTSSFCYTEWVKASLSKKDFLSLSLPLVGDR